VTTVFLKVAHAHFKTTLAKQDQPHTISLHLDFLRRTQTGPALFTVKDTKLGRQASVIHVTLTQGEPGHAREEVVGYITNSNMHTESGVSFSTGYALSPAPPAVDLALLKQNRDAAWEMQQSTPFPSFRRASMKTLFYFPRGGQRRPGSADEWIRLESGERWTNASLGYVADMWPMPVEAFITAEAARAQTPRTARFWYPTVLLNLDFKKALPEEGVEWLFVRAAAKQIKNGRMDIEVVILDEGGDIVALSHHVALAVSSARNLAERNNGAKI
jgi:hypothetical protein